MAASVISDDVKVSDHAFEFLRLQKGKLEPIAKDRKRWELEYNRSLRSDYLEMKPYLPKLGSPSFVLDVGSGLGGIDVLLNRHYHGYLTPILLDGIEDDPVMRKHRFTYSNFEVAKAFHRDNGVEPILSVEPIAAMKAAPPLAKVSLVISLGSWCFHYAPDTYLDFVLRSVKQDAVIITDVRRGDDKVAWMEMLEKVFVLRAVIRRSDKYQRCVFVT